MGRDLIYLWESLLWLHTEMTNIQDNSTVCFTARLEFYFFFWSMENYFPHLPGTPPSLRCSHFSDIVFTMVEHLSLINQALWIKHTLWTSHCSRAHQSTEIRHKHLERKGENAGTSGQFAGWQGSHPQLDTTLQPTRENKLGGAWICSPGRSRALEGGQEPQPPYWQPSCELFSSGPSSDGHVENVERCWC